MCYGCHTFQVICVSSVSVLSWVGACTRGITVSKYPPRIVSHVQCASLLLRATCKHSACVEFVCMSMCMCVGMDVCTCMCVIEVNSLQVKIPHNLCTHTHTHTLQIEKSTEDITEEKIKCTHRWLKKQKKQMLIQLVQNSIPIVLFLQTG